jgi:hypothetical protein
LDRVGGADVTGALRVDPGAGSATGLRPGRNRIVARAGGLGSTLSVDNHPAAGPTISGPHQQPYVCTTERFTLIGGTKLGRPVDADCSATTRVRYAYRTTGGSIKALAAKTMTMVKERFIEGYGVPRFTSDGAARARSTCTAAARSPGSPAARWTTPACGTVSPPSTPA